ncbi:Hcr2-0B [Thecamonas trahens ATCC 50062]|uniref:Hcr2-0B n=1 Tax=Thecamonas trahens ATCC 50062 TaxID=461836 RepID=A0A0L0DT39_THETB|nr:Hcr2-0B [Thecamonas trahens ATCC 50062]KNC55201.1 Hcr2-0B [Thecamonas trahens ATCC 50062]|eukprot:XP_013753135.1 Hcr2-0B [Thecamonas trahens ATCC 50062]
MTSIPCCTRAPAILALLAVMVAVTGQTVVAADLASEAAELDALFDALSGSMWTNNGGWEARAGSAGTPDAVCSYYGITCSNTSTSDGLTHVIAITLSGNAMAGTLPPIAWDFPELVTLDLTGNVLSGTLPAAWGKMSKLELLLLGGKAVPSEFLLSFLSPAVLYFYTLGSLVGSELEGTLPPEWGALSNLRILALNTGARTTGGFAGSDIPPEWAGMTSLRYLTFDSSGLGNGGPLPAHTLAAMSSLEYFGCSYCDYSSIPEAITSAPKLHSLYLNYMPINGPLPAFIPRWSALRALIVGAVGLTGPLPTDWSALTNVRIIVLAENANLVGTLAPFAPLPALEVLMTYKSGITGTLPIFTSPDVYFLVISGQSLSGSIPPQWGEMTKMQQLWMGENAIEGTLPASLANWTSLKLIDVRNNRLTGTVPVAFGTAWSQVGRFELAHNSFTGTLPPGFASVTHVDISGNAFPARSTSYNLFDSVPENCNISAITIDLSGNNLQGMLPAGIGNIKGLQHLSLAGNKLTSSFVPLSWAKLSPSLVNIDLSRNQISGDVTNMLATFRDFARLQRVDISHNQLVGTMRGNLFVEVFPAPRNFFQTLVLMYVNNNQITGNVPPWFDTVPTILEFDGSANNFTGSVDTLTESVQSAKFADNPELGEQDRISLPSSIVPIEPFVQLSADQPFSCPSFIDVRRSRSSVVLDPRYYGYQLCKCDPGYFGEAGQCRSCAPFGDAVRCEGGRIDLADLSDGSNTLGIDLSSSATAAAASHPAGFVSAAEADVVPSGPNWGGAVPHRANLTIQPNYYVAGYKDDGTPLIDECYLIGIDESSCNPEAKDPFECRNGYRDRLCSRCEKDYYLQGRRCEACPTATPIVLAALYGAVFLVWYGMNQTNKKSVFYAPLIKSLFVFLQTSAILFSGSSAFVWPSSVTTAFDSVFSWTSFSFPMLACLSNSNSKWELSFFVSLFAVPALFFIPAIGYAIFAGLSAVVDGGLFGRSERDWRFGAIRTGLAVLNLGYMPITVNMLVALPCRTSSDGNYYLWAAPWIECSRSNSDWLVIVVTGTIMTILYGLGIPFAFSLLLRWRRRYLRSLPPGMGEADGHWFQFFYAPYLERSFWFELVIMARRLLVAIIAVMPATNPLVPFAFFTVLMGALVVQFTVKPFVHNIINWLEILTLVQLMLTFSVGQVFSSDVYTTDLSFTATILEVLVILTNVFVVAAFLVVLLWRLVMTRRRGPKTFAVSMSSSDETGAHVSVASSRSGRFKMHDVPQAQPLMTAPLVGGSGVELPLISRATDRPTTTVAVGRRPPSARDTPSVWSSNPTVVTTIGQGNDMNRPETAGSSSSDWSTFDGVSSMLDSDKSSAEDHAATSPALPGSARRMATKFEDSVGTVPRLTSSVSTAPARAQQPTPLLPMF